MKHLITLLIAAGISTGNASAQDAADEYYDPTEMEAARQMIKHEMGGQTHYLFMVDRFEFQSAGEGAAVWDTQGWIGGDFNRMWFKSEGEYSFGEDSLEEGNVELLYGRVISPYFDVQVGIGQGLEAGPSSTYGTIALQGLAPYWFEVDAALQLSIEGDITASLELEYELLFTQKLILQPRIEVQLSMQQIPEYGLGSGLTSIDTGARLRYEFKRKFAPYIGASWHHKFGKTADFARLAGEGSSSLNFVLGIRTWF